MVEMSNDTKKSFEKQKIPNYRVLPNILFLSIIIFYFTGLTFLNYRLIAHFFLLLHIFKRLPSPFLLMSCKRHILDFHQILWMKLLFEDIPYTPNF